MTAYQPLEMPEEGIESTSILLHAMRLYDSAGRIAHNQNDFDKLLQVGDRILEASGQLIAISINQPQQREEEEDVRLDAGEFGSFNFEFGLEIDVPPEYSVTEFFKETHEMLHDVLLDTLVKEGVIDNPED